MLSTQHAITGSVVATATGNPILGFLAAVVSHHVLDTLPHVDGILVKQGENFSSSEGDVWPKSKYVLAYSDVILTGLIVIYVALNSHRPELVLIGAAGGILPDFLDNVPYWNKAFRKTVIGKKWHQLHENYHWVWRNANWFKLSLAILLQLIITLGGIWVLLKNFSY